MNTREFFNRWMYWKRQSNALLKLPLKTFKSFIGKYIYRPEKKTLRKAVGYQKMVSL